MFAKTKEHSLDKFKHNFGKPEYQKEKRMTLRSKSFESNSNREINIKQIKEWLIYKVKVSQSKLAL